MVLRWLELASLYLDKNHDLLEKNSDLKYNNTINMLTIIGFSHHRCPVGLREQITFDSGQYHVYSKEISSLLNSDSVIFLSTCNRSEIIIETKCAFDKDIVLSWLATHMHIGLDKIQNNYYVHTNFTAVTHLLNVCCGLHSKLVGESQIFGQFKKAYTLAKKHEQLSPKLDRLIQELFTITKRIRASTKIDQYTGSISKTIKALALKHVNASSKLKILAIGTGEMTMSALKAWDEVSASSIIIASRSQERAENFAKMFYGTGIKIQEIPRYIDEVDIVISASASQLPLIGKGMVESALHRNPNKQITFFDLAVPRDIEPEISGLSGMSIYNIDEIQQKISELSNKREHAFALAKGMVASEVQKLQQKIYQREHQAAIVTLRSEHLKAKESHLQKALQQLASGKDPAAIIETCLNQFSKQILHGPTTILKEAIATEDETKVSALIQLFAQDTP